MMESEFCIIHKKPSDNDIVHYRKINIFGDAGVGKSSLISLMENYSDEDFKIVPKISDSDISIKNTSSLVEQIKRLKIKINEDDDINLFLNVYETNLDKYDYIKMNLDTLLLQTECIIIMWDINKIDSFDNIPNLIATINEGIKDYKFRDAPIFLINNKIDLEIKESEKSELENDIKDSFKKIKSENKNIIFKEISLLEKDDFYNLILDINRKINTSDKIIENRINYDNPCLVKFKNYKKMSIDFEIMDNNITINCILLGHSCVGKTTFFNYFYGKNNEENENYNLSTISNESLFLLAEFNNEKFYVKITDTAGQERFLSISKNYIRNADGILLFFDVTTKESFDNIEQWISIIKETIGDDSKIILIANKIDSTDERAIFKKEAKEKANKYNLKYFECCCLNGLNLYEILNEIIVGAYSKYYEKNPNGIKRAKTVKLNENQNYWKGWKNYCWESLPNMPHLHMPSLPSLPGFKKKSSKIQCITLKQQ